jgi:hypothetical protein
MLGKSNMKKTILKFFKISLAYNTLTGYETLYKIFDYNFCSVTLYITNIIIFNLLN